MSVTLRLPSRVGLDLNQILVEPARRQSLTGCIFEHLTGGQALRRLVACTAANRGSPLLSMTVAAGALGKGQLDVNSSSALGQLELRSESTPGQR